MSIDWQKQLLRLNLHKDFVIDNHVNNKQKALLFITYIYLL